MAEGGGEFTWKDKKKSGSVENDKLSS